MPDPWIAAVVVLLVVVAALAVAALLRLGTLVAARDAASREAEALRTKLAVLAEKSDDFERDVKQDLANARVEQTNAAKNERDELNAALARHASATQEQLIAMARAQSDQLQRFGEGLAALTKSSEARLEAVRQTVEQRLDVLREDNTKKLEQMRATVDEKLQATLEQRLGESFRQVADRLEQVHRGLGEMQTLAVGVGDLKRVLTNVKTRGTWGEVQLAALIGEVLTPAQYATNVETVPGSNRRVEFAIRLPGRGDDGAPCWLPVDAKFPLEEWQRLQDALERADQPAAEGSRRALAEFLRAQAKTIREAYIEPPHTTDFAILFVPTEGLYAEMMSRPGFAEQLQRDHRVTLAGPTNFLALLNSLQMGFRTLAIEKRSTEVWRVLGAVKTEFGKFGEILARTKDKLDLVGKTLDEAGRKSTTIARKLRDVEALPEGEADRLLTGENGGLLLEGDAATPPAAEP
jgi:DNA recombination protein RmuC